MNTRQVKFDWNNLMFVPALVTLFITVFFFFHQSTRSSNNAVLLNAARNTTASIALAVTRDISSPQRVSRLLGTGYPNTDVTKEFAAQVNAELGGATVQFVTRSGSNIDELTPFERESFRLFRTGERGYHASFLETPDGRVLNYAVPVELNNNCTNCKHQQSVNKRGQGTSKESLTILFLTQDAPHQGLVSPKGLLTFLALVLIFGLIPATVLGQLQRQNRRYIEQLQSAKRESEENAIWLKAIVDESVDGILTTDRSGVIERANPALAEMFGYETDELLGRNVSVLMQASHASRLRRDVAGFLDGRRSAYLGRTNTAKGLRKDGSTFPLDVAIGEFKTGNRQHFTGFVRDATSRHAFVADQKRLRAQFQDAVTSAMDAIVVIDERSVILEFNPAAESIFGFNREDVVGQSLTELIVPARYRDAHKAGMLKLLDTGEGPVLNNRIEIEAVKSDQTEILVELAIKQSEGPSGRIFFGYMRDITDKKASESALIVARDRAEVASRAKASFLAMMSHEIRTPLNGVLGILGLLHNEELAPEQKRLITTARKSGKSLLNIINDILDFSKLEAGKFEIETCAFDLTMIIKAIEGLLGIRAAEKGISLRCEIDASVPPILIGDPDRLRQILLNLAWNAIKFTKTGSVTIHASWDTSDAHSIVRFEVSDTGIGIHQDHHAELFAEFATLDASYSRRFGGTGLGLAICKSLVGAMDGEIGVESEVDKGSTFWFEIPMETGSVDDLPDEGIDDDDYLPDFSGVRVLLAEDNGTNQLVIGNLLEKFGCLVDVVGNGREAVDSNGQRRYDLILMDVSMPELDGIEATKEIRSPETPNSDVPIVALTAFATKDDRARVLEAGMDDFVAKPVERRLLVQAMQRQLQKCPENQAPSAAEQQAGVSNAFDRQVLTSILRDASDEFRHRVIGNFLKDINSQIAEIMKARDDGDLEAIATASHAMKGVAGTFGARDLHRVAKDVNDLARSGQDAELGLLLEELQNLSEIATRTLPTELHDLKLAPYSEETIQEAV